MTGILEALKPVFEILFKVLIEFFWDKADDWEEIKPADSNAARAERFRERVRDTKARRLGASG